MKWNAQPNAPLPGTHLGAIDDIDDGGVRTLALGKMPPFFQLILLRSGLRVFGYLNRCAHFGVPLASQPHPLLFESNKFIQCNVHYARFDWESGLCIAGDCEGDYLEKLPIDVVDGQIFIAPQRDGQTQEQAITTANQSAC